jgi:hypothetical protein
VEARGEVNAIVIFYANAQLTFRTPKWKSPWPAVPIAVVGFGRTFVTALRGMSFFE